MANTILITANWHTGALSQQTISRQYDNNRYVGQFVGYPEASEGNELDYYLLVWMSSAPGEKPAEIAPIQLASDQWYVSNVFTQQTQQIKFQMCALNTEGTFEAHSPIFIGFVRNSLEHDGTTQDIDVSTLFDAYREYLNELIIRAGAVVIDSAPTQGSNNAVSSGGVYSALAGKVAKPLTSPNGTSGQLLRTLGNGQTEWTDFATPTTEQVGEAVENWLDDHPEATTTVQDWSLTANKLVKGALGFVTPEMFGAVGDGTTDDTQALKNCIDYAMANNFVVQLSAKTYIVSPSVLSFEIADGQSIIIIGQGQNSTVKLKDAGLDGSWSQLFTIIISPVSSKAHDVVFSNFCIDGNRRNQGEIAPDSYAYEASQMISIRGSATGTLANGLYLDRFIVDNMRFYDPVADCVNISGSNQVGVRDVFLHRIVSTDRQGTRNDIGITGNPLHLVHISDCDCDSIHFEYNDTPADNLVIPYIISNCRFGKCTLAAKIDLHMSGCVITDDFLLGGMTSAKIANCDIYFTGDHYNVREATRTGVFAFESCKFNSGVYTNNNTQVLSSFYVYLCGRCTFLNCEFNYVGGVLDLDLDGDTVADHISGYAIDVNSSEKEPVIIDNCVFDKRYQYLLRHCGTVVTLKNMEVNTGTVAYHYGIAGQASDTEYAEIEFDNIKLGRDCKYSIKIGNVTNGTPTRAKGEIITLQSNFPMPYESSGSYVENWMANVSGDFHRKVYVDEPLTLTTITEIASQKGYSSRDYFYLLNGDTFVYNGANPERYPEKWVVIDRGITAIKNGNVAVGSPLEDRIISIGSGTGATADRPTCYLSKGFVFFDTTLGKPVFWNGTGWVDSTGATV